MRRPFRMNRRFAAPAALVALGGLLGLVPGSPAGPSGLGGTGALNDPLPVTIRVDAGTTLGPMRPVWRFFGYDEPNYTYMRDGQKLLGQLAALSPEPVYIRTHNLLTSGDGTPALKWGSTGVYSEDEQGNPRYDWTILDRIFDTYRDRGVRPLVEIGFMPQALSTHPEPYQHSWTPGGKASISTGWAYPPHDYAKWGELVHQWVRHCVDRYGADEVEHWYWEVWNEPNILYWRGTREEYQRLYDHAVTAVKRALPTARVGGPHVAGPRTPESTRFLRGFLEHCLRGTNDATGAIGAPLDFVAFHAKGSPRFLDGHVRTGIASQLQDIDRGFEVVASYPELKSLPVIIGESDPDGCAACPSTVYPQNGYRNGTLYASYTAASFARKYELAERRGVNFEGAVTWAFEFEDQPYFAGFRVLSTNGIPLPVLNVFRMFGLMGGERLQAESTGELPLEVLMKDGALEPDVGVVACRQGDRLSILLWHHHDDDVPGPDAAIDLNIANLPAGDRPVLLQHSRIDREHSNAFARWQAMGSPQPPSPEQVVELERASQLALLESPTWHRPRDGKLSLPVVLPRQAVSLLVLDTAH
jgi:xylan 1,4-beta-xylosidase